MLQPMHTIDTDYLIIGSGTAGLASGAEICGYFDRVMQHRLLPSGRVAYHPMSNYLGDGEFVRRRL